jgi:hypothetical protein
MPSLYCEHCGFRIQFRPAVLWMENCPRCQVHSKTLIPLVLSPRGRWISAQVDRSEPQPKPSAARPSRQQASPVG